MGSTNPWMLCVAIAATYLCSVYLLSPSYAHLARDHPTVIKRGFYAVALACLVSWIPYALSMDSQGLLLEKLGLRLPGLMAACTIPLVLTMTLFLGPIVQGYLDGDSLLSGKGHTTLSFLRMHVSAPVGEEWCFRACMLPLLLDADISPTRVVLTCPLLFGIAHLYNAVGFYRAGKPVGIVMLAIGVQCAFTTVFGWYAALLFYRTGHVAAPILAHSFCNHMGFPAFGAVPSHPRAAALGSAYAVGIVGFICLLRPLTAPGLYSNPLVECWGRVCEHGVPQ